MIKKVVFRMVQTEESDTYTETDNIESVGVEDYDKEIETEEDA